MITYTVREPGQPAWLAGTTTLAQAREERGGPRARGLLRAEVYAHFGEATPHVVVSRRDPHGATWEEREGVRLAATDLAYVADGVLVVERHECLDSPAYRAGYLDGLSRDLTGYGSVDDLRAARTAWSEGVGYLVGVHVLAQLCRCDVLRLDEHLWAYDAGCRAGVLAPQEHRTGRPPCP